MGLLSRRLPAPAPLWARVLPFAALAAAATLGILLAAGANAVAEEAIVLDNGAVLRGTVVREDPTSFEFRLAGVGSETRITIPRERVAQRFTTVDPGRWRAVAQAARPALGEGRMGEAPRVVSLERAGAEAAAPPIPDEEPGAHEESIFERIARRAALAFPSDVGSRAVLAALVLAVLLCFVGLGAKMAEIEGLTIGRGAVLATLLVSLLAVDLLWPRMTLRADHAMVAVPIEVLAWVGCAALTLRCGFARSFLLLGFVTLSGALAAFAAGVVIVSV